MTFFERSRVSRRGLLQGAIVVTGYALNGAASQRDVPIYSAALKVAEPLVDRTTMAKATFFTQAWTEQVTAAFPVQYKLVGRDQKSTLNIDWDARLFAVHDVVSGVVGDGIRKLSVRRDGAQSLRIDIPSDVSEVVFRADVINNYPSENLVDAQGAGFSLIDESGELLEQWRDVPVGVRCSAWSVEATVNWICHEGWIVPARIAVASIGPSAAPAGTVVRACFADMLSLPVLVDPTTPEALNPRAVEKIDNASRHRLPAELNQSIVDGICELTLTTTDSLAAGSSLELLFEVEASDSKPRPFGEFVPRMNLVPPADPTGMRNSRRHSDFPVTSSGSQRSSYLPEPTA